MNRTRIQDRGSRSVKTLEKAWVKLQTIVKDLPSVVFVSLDTSSRRRRRGHFFRSSWHYRGLQNAHEIGISPALFESPKEVLATMLHEAAHALLNKRTGTPGCGSGGYYHLKEFRDCCQELGLKCSFRNTRYGFTNTGWDVAGVPDRYQVVLSILRRGLPWGTATQFPLAHPKQKKLPISGHARLSCGCGRSVYASNGVASSGPIVCGLCSGHFR